jgi:hypothetical protein
MVAAMSNLASEAAQLARLSPRQREVLEALARTGASAGGAARHELLDLQLLHMCRTLDSSNGSRSVRYCRAEDPRSPQRGLHPHGVRKHVMASLD